MIFCGDIAIPYKKGVQFSNFPDELLKKDWFGNLEGSLIGEDDIISKDLLNQRVVFNSYEAIKDLKSKINFRAFGIANNHIKDAANLRTTFYFLDSLKVNYVGAGYNLALASEPILFTSDGIDYAIIAFGWDFIKCIYASNSQEGVNPYTKKNITLQIEKLKERCIKRRIIAFMHWNYELELYPQPLDREIAHYLIDSGFFAVIGCHAHRVQPIEVYKNRPIVYGLGNFAFRQNTYMNGQLKFPTYSTSEIAFEITKEGNFIVHKIKYNPQNHDITYLSSSEVTEKTIFTDLTLIEYKKFFSQNRCQKKALPILNYEDSNLVYYLKRSWVKFRGYLIDILVRNRSLFKMVKTIIARFYEGN